MSPNMSPNTPPRSPTQTPAISPIVWPTGPVAGPVAGPGAPALPGDASVEQAHGRRSSGLAQPASPAHNSLLAEFCSVSLLEQPRSAFDEMLPLAPIHDDERDGWARLAMNNGEIHMEWIRVADTGEIVEGRLWLDVDSKDFAQTLATWMNARPATADEHLRALPAMLEQLSARLINFARVDKFCDWLCLEGFPVVGIQTAPLPDLQRQADWPPPGHRWLTTADLIRRDAADPPG
jgi:hypothetical protein